MDRDGQTTVNARNIGALRVEGDQYNYYYTLAEQTLKSNVEQPPVDVYVPRQAELAKLADALTTHAGVSLTSAQAIGEGRYGKTWLARAYAHQFRKDRYPGGIFEIRCGENASLLDLLANLPGPTRHPSGAELKREERAYANFAYFSGQKQCLLILDNVESAEQYEEFRESGLLPVDHCHLLVTTRSFDLPHLTRVPVGRLTDDEGAQLLAKYFPDSSQLPYLVQLIITEAEGMAVLIAAVGASLQEGTLNDMADYVRWLTDIVPEPDTDGTWANYPQKSGAIFHSLYQRLAKASVRALEFAALFPPDQINPDDLEAVLLADQSDPELGWKTQITGAPVAVRTYLRPLREREILTGPETGSWSLHRLHRRALTARLSDRELAARVARLHAPASERFQTASDEDDQSLHWSAITNISYSIALIQTIRDARAPRGEWGPNLQNDLAGTYVNRGEAYLNAQDLAAAIGDYGVALPILSQLADTFAEFGVDVHRLLANWSLLGVGLTPDHIRLALTNLQRLETRFDAPTLARLQVPLMNQMIADGLPKVTPRLSPTELAAARTALLGTA
jgi:hypothetical protein